MKRVCTLTFCDTPNYGALLQAYALKEYLLSVGYSCTIINYQNPKRRYSQVSGIRKIRSKIWRTFFSRIFDSRKRTELTSEFRKKELGLGKVYKSVEELKELNRDCDVFVVGSDQVWNPKNNGFDNAYLLSFVADNKKRISYAASLGSTDESYLELNADLFKRIDAISVREKQSADIIQSNLGISARTVIDPVFLLDINDWNSRLNLTVTSHDKKMDSDFVLCYVMPGDQELTNKIFKVAKTLAEKKNLKIITLGKKNYSKGIENELLDGDAGPIEFLKYIKNAAYVVTNSFHGTALSVVFQKQFYTVLKNGNKRNVRMEDLLSSISLSERIIYTENSSENVVRPSIDYSIATQLLNEQIEYSRQFLIQAIEG